MTERSLYRHIPQTDGFRWTHFIVSVILLPVVYYFNGVHVSQQQEIKSNTAALAIMQGNRFTSADGLEVWKEIGRIREAIAALPPQNFKDKMDRMERDLSDVKASIARMEALLKERDR